MNQPDHTSQSNTARSGRDSDIPLPTHMPMLEEFVLRSPRALASGVAAGSSTWAKLFRLGVTGAAAVVILATGVTLVFSAMVLVMALIPAIIFGLTGALFIGGALLAFDRVKAQVKELQRETHVEQP